MADDDDDPVELSAHAVNALNEFYREQSTLMNDQSIDEDWELSQFWYDRETSLKLANECLRITTGHGRIACVSCPTLFKALKEIPREPDSRRILLFEYDHRFNRYGDDFVFYDYRLPVDEMSSDHLHSFDLIVADPPFLSEECVLKVTQFVDALKKREHESKIIFCTGLAVGEYVMRGIEGEHMRVCDSFVPTHQRKLGNEFRCYVNYEGAFPGT